MNLSHLTMWRHAVEPNHSKHQEQNSWVPVLHTDYVKSFQCSHARRQIVVSKCTVHSNAELVAVLKSDHIRFSRYLSIFFGITFVFCSQWAGQIQEYVLMHTISVCNGSIWFDMGSYQNWTGPYMAHHHFGNPCPQIEGLGELVKILRISPHQSLHQHLLPQQTLPEFLTPSWFEFSWASSLHPQILKRLANHSLTNYYMALARTGLLLVASSWTCSAFAFASFFGGNCIQYFGLPGFSETLTHDLMHAMHEIRDNEVSWHRNEYQGIRI